MHCKLSLKKARFLLKWNERLKSTAGPAWERLSEGRRFFDSKHRTEHMFTDFIYLNPGTKGRYKVQDADFTKLDIG